MVRFTRVLQQKLQSRFGFFLVLLILALVCFAPQVSPNDWDLNPAHLPEGFNIYQDGNYLYPPWALIVFWPYYFLGAIGTRLLSILLVVWLYIKNQRSILDFLFIFLNPIFIFSLLYSNPDILIFIGAVLLWDTKHWLLMALALSLISVKPQGAIFVIPYLIFQKRSHWRELLKTFGLASLIILPISLIGEPRLFLQWLDNVQNPSDYWASMRLANDVSMTAHYGLAVAGLGLALVSAAFYYAFKKVWTRQHTLGSLFIVSMLFSPYASLQSLIVGFIFIPSWQSTLGIGLLSVLVAWAEIWKPNEPLWLIIFWGLALLFYMQAANPAAQKAENTPNSLETA